MQVLLAAAASVPEIAQHKQTESDRYGDQRRLADTLSDRKQLRQGLSADRAADVIWTLAGPSTYTDLVRHRGWDEQD